jgi:hypothetical protein
MFGEMDTWARLPESQLLPESEPHGIPPQRHRLEPLETDGGRRIPRALCLRMHSSCGQVGLVDRAVRSPVKTFWSVGRPP